MEHNGNENMPPPTLCRMGCGFYGNAATDGMCSKCHRDALKRKQNSSPISGRASPAGEMDRVSSVTATLSQTNLGASNINSTVPASSGSSIVSKTSVTDISSSSHCSSSSSSVETATPTVTVTTSSQGKDENTEEDGAIADCASSSSSDDVKLSESDKKPKKNRCNTCRKKVGLTGFLCRCGGLYCSLHRYSDKHSCTFDYKEMAQEQIRKNNPVIVGEKVKKI